MTGPPKKPKRPVWVWIICIFYAFSALWTILSFYLILSRSIPVTPPVKAYMESLGAIDYAATIILLLLSLSATLTLFMLRKEAYYLFCTSLIINIAMTIWHSIAKGALEAMASIKGSMTGAVIGWAILSAICIYSRHLKSRQILT